MTQSFQSSTWFITGGTGLLGSAIIQILRENDISVITLIREDSDPDKVKRLKDLDAKILTGEILEPSTYNLFLPTVDVVCHTAAAINTDQKEKYWRINFEGTRTLVDQMREMGVKRIIYISTAVVYNRRKKERYNESSKIQAVGKYAKSKLAAEKYILNQETISATILRPPLIYGDIFWDRHVIPKLIERTPHRFVPVIAGKKPRIGFVHAEDVARLVLLAGSNPKTPSDIYNLQSFEIEYEELLQYVEDARDESITKIVLPYALHMVVAFIGDMFRYATGKEPLLRRRLQILGNNWIFSKERANSELGWDAIHQDPTELLRLMTEYVKSKESSTTSEDIRDLMNSG